MAADDIDVNYVAHLARLALTPEKGRKFGEQLGGVLGYIDKLKQVDVTGIEPTAHAFPLVNVARRTRSVLPWITSWPCKMPPPLPTACLWFPRLSSDDHGLPRSESSKPPSPRGLLFRQEDALNGGCDARARWGTVQVLP